MLSIQPVIAKILLTCKNRYINIIHEFSGGDGKRGQFFISRKMKGEEAVSWEPRFATTGIGSLPYTEEEEALTLVFRYFPDIPHWPQLPGRGKEEGFVEQFAPPLLKAGLATRDNEGRVVIDFPLEKGPELMTSFLEKCLAAEEGDGEALNFFAFPPEAASGFYAFMRKVETHNLPEGAVMVKGQISGPVTVGFYLKDGAGKAIYYEPQLREILLRTLGVQALWQGRELAKSGLPVLLFIDDPGMYAYGSSLYVGLQREDIVSGLRYLTELLHREGIITGVHSCAGIDWTLLLEGGVKVISFDAYNYFDSLVVLLPHLTDFLAGGGVLAWGIVPTSPAVDGESTESLVERLEAHFNWLAERGIPLELLCRQALITPACGTGTLTPERAELVYRLTAELAAKMRAKYFK